MKIIITENQLFEITKFNKEKIEKGKYADSIEKIVVQFLGAKNVCDTAVVTTSYLNNEPIVILVLVNKYFKSGIETKISNLVKSFIPVENVIVIVTESTEGCKGLSEVN